MRTSRTYGVEQSRHFARKNKMLCIKFYKVSDDIKTYLRSFPDYVIHSKLFIAVKVSLTFQTIRSLQAPKPAKYA